MVYAFNSIQKREALWTDLKRIAGGINGPWMVGGDFNCVLTPEERLGGGFVLAEALPFQDCIDACALVDSPSMGAYFTWNNKRQPEDRVFSRLDRCLVNQEWMHIKNDFKAHFLPEGLFDHCPRLILNEGPPHSRKRGFKYFNMWSKAPNFEEVVTQGWEQVIEGTKMYRVAKKLQGLKQGLKSLYRAIFLILKEALK
ncbi:uncharacterized protein LOC141641041 [Silene latifolia]|uniref:uncharacterized protein LOC141641041 n=1 Tax=Silene latifolia TaxID=37657 RepID=UPI003D783C09